MDLLAVIQLPATYDAVWGAMIAAHEAVNRACNDQWFADGLYETVLSIGAEDRPSSVFNICRHAGDGRDKKPCGCYLRCACGWLVANGGVCTNPHHTVESAKPKGAPHDDSLPQPVRLPSLEVLTIAEAEARMVQKIDERLIAVSREEAAILAVRRDALRSYP
jgi:hypothetical protein